MNEIIDLYLLGEYDVPNYEYITDNDYYLNLIQNGATYASKRITPDR